METLFQTIYDLAYFIKKWIKDFRAWYNRPRGDVVNATASNYEGEQLDRVVADEQGEPQFHQLFGIKPYRLPKYWNDRIESEMERTLWRRQMHEAILQKEDEMLDKLDDELMNEFLHKPTTEYNTRDVVNDKQAKDIGKEI